MTKYTVNPFLHKLFPKFYWLGNNEESAFLFPFYVCDSLTKCLLLKIYDYNKNISLMKDSFGTLDIQANCN